MRTVALLILCVSLVRADYSATFNASSFTTESPTKIDYEAMAMELVENASIRMQTHWMRLRDIFLTSNRKFIQVNHAPAMNDIQLSYRRFSNQLAYNLSVIPLRELKNDVLRRQVKILGKLQLSGLEDDDYEKAMNILRTMRGFGTNRLVCHYYTDDCSTMVAQIPHIHDDTAKSRNLDEMEYYWTSWRKEISELARVSFIEYTYLFRKAAALNGHVTPSKTWYLYYEEDNFLKELESAYWDIMPLYKEMHAFMRNVLKNKYGWGLIADDGTIPQHLMEQVLSNAWRAKSVFSPPYKNKKLPDVKQKMDEGVFTPLKINELSAKFFESLGLNHLSSNFWNKYSRKMSDEEAGADCKAIVFYFPPDVALRYCPKVDFKKFLQMHGHMSELQYNLYKANLPYGLDREACPGFGNAIGEAAIISAGSPRHLEKTGLIENYTLDNELTMNRLFRLGVHTLISIPMYFVNEKFLVDALDYRFHPNELNCGYWKIQQKYAGVSPPNKRSEKQFDPSFTFYKGLDPNKPNTVKLISEILGYQVYRALCLASKRYIPDDPNFPLHNCDFYEQESAGTLIKDLMKLGSTKHWRDAMEMLTGERKLSGKAIMEYYAPLYEWLKEENKRNRVHVGWNANSRMCQSDN